MTRPRSVLIFGTFDVLHPGHLWFLKKAAAYGRSVIALTPDNMCFQYKGFWPIHSFKFRKWNLERIRYVSEVVPADNKPDSFAVVQRLKPDVIVIGYDQTLLKSHLVKRLQELRLKP